VAVGFTLTVPSGTVIRCNSTASIAGSIVVLPAPNGAAAKRTGGSASLVSAAYQPPGSPQGFAAAGTGELTLITPGNLSGGDGGTAVKSLSGTTAGLQFYSHMLRGSNLVGGGGAASIGINLQAFGGGGGGSFGLFAKQTISVTGTINASGGSTGSAGAGGGAGGLIVLASAQSVSITGSGGLLVRGTGGGDSDASVGAGGGGGGGIVQLLAPSVPNQSAIDGCSTVNGGVA